MIILRLALASLKNRAWTTGLTIFSIALSVALLLSVERMRRGAEEGFTQTISQTDLIVGARGGALNLLLYSVFNMGSATNNVSFSSYEEWRKNPAIEWTIPFSLGDGHRGFRVVGTDDNFYLHYRFRGDQAVGFQEGVKASGLWDAVLGFEVAKTLGYRLGDRIVIAHGVTSGEGILKHDDKPFTVVGIMAPTGTALDRSIYITLEGLEALHVDWKDGAMPTTEASVPASRIKKEDLKVGTITAFFLRTKTRIETLRLQRAINTWKDEPLMAIIPGVTLSELWRGMDYLEKTLRTVSWMVLLIGLMSMLVALLTLLDQRRREISILRAVGASPWHVLSLLLFESLLLTAAGLVLGTLAQIALFALLKGWLATSFGIYLTGAVLAMREFLFLLAALILGTFVGIFPALKAFFFTLKDGLSVKN